MFAIRDNCAQTLTCLRAGKCLNPSACWPEQASPPLRHVEDPLRIALRGMIDAYEDIDQPASAYQLVERAKAALALPAVEQPMIKPPHVDALFNAMITYKLACEDAVALRAWGDFDKARKKLRAWFEENGITLDYGED